jgi:hypothetical protein
MATKTKSSGALKAEAEKPVALRSQLRLVRLVHPLSQGELSRLEPRPLSGTQSSGATRKYDVVETYGLLSPDFAAPKIG